MNKLDDLTLDKILKDSNSTRRWILKDIVDKSIPFGIIKNNRHLLKEFDVESVLSLILLNNSFKKIVLSEVNYIEDMLSTGVYNSKFGKVSCKELICDEKYKDFWPKDKKSNNKKEFEEFVKRNSILKNDNNSIKGKDFMNYTFFEFFYSRTLGGKIILVKFMDRDVATKLIKSHRTKFSKIELISLLEYSRRIRNYLAHNFFVLDEKPYLEMMIDSSKDNKLKTDEEKIEFLFSKLEILLRIHRRQHPIKSVIEEIEENDFINLDHLNILLIDIIKK